MHNANLFITNTAKPSLARHLLKDLRFLDKDALKALHAKLEECLSEGNSHDPEFALSRAEVQLIKTKKCQIHDAIARRYGPKVANAMAPQHEAA